MKIIIGTATTVLAIAPVVCPTTFAVVPTTWPEVLTATFVVVVATDPANETAEVAAPTGDGTVTVQAQLSRTKNKRKGVSNFMRGFAGTLSESGRSYQRFTYTKPTKAVLHHG